MLRRISPRLAILGLVLAGFAPSARAADSLVLVQDNPAQRDLVLAVHGRQALSADPEFRDLAIIVQVKKGIAELRGQVPSDALATKAVKLVEEVSGIIGVRNYLEVRAARRDPGVLVLEPEPPTSARAASPNLLRFPDVPLNIPPIPVETPRKPEPERPASPAPPTVVLLTPIFTEEPSPQPAPVPDVLVTRTRPTTLVKPTGSVESALLALLAEPAFKEVKVEVRGNAVRVLTREGQGATTMALARRLRDLPGVEEIVLVPEGR
jgi:hypothetical protein